MMHASFFLSILALLPRTLASSDLAYCAEENTGSNVVVNTYQSNGACESTCSEYGLGILQGKKCWCSNIAPANASTVDTSECDTGCPGYPSDSCGSASKGVYAYVLINSKSITSTATGTSVSHTEAASTTTANVALTTSSNGDVKTITVAAAESTSDSSGSKATDTSDKSSGLSGGSIAGVVIGVVGGLALVGALVFLIFFYRKRARSTSPVPSQDMTDRNSQTSNWSRGVFPGGAGGSMNRQNTFIDNRMRPNAVYPSGSRDSSVSLQDNEDYSRPVLRLTNPD